MGENAMNGLSDRGSTPLSSILSRILNKHLKVLQT